MPKKTIIQIEKEDIPTTYNQIINIAERMVREYDHGGGACFLDTGMRRSQYINAVNDFLLYLKFEIGGL